VNPDIWARSVSRDDLGADRPGSETLRAQIRRAIRSAGGAISFRDFMELALYDENGFYAAGGQAGRRAHFLTSPEVGPLFGAVLARFLDAEFARLGAPDPFTVVDAGAGPGTLARAVLAAQPACAGALSYVAVERSPRQREQHPAGIESRPGLPPGPIDGVILANELLDNLPFRLAAFDGAWREALVTESDDGAFVEVLSSPLAPVPAVLPDRPAHGARAPLQDDASAWLSRARSLLRSGRVVVIDYARTSTAELTGRPWRDWLRTYRAHGRGGHYLAEPGEQDITADLALDQFPEPDAARAQAQFLRRWGIEELVDEGRRAWERAAATPDLLALAMRSRVSEAEALLDPSGLGGFTVAEWVAA
jgi:SAM-dependent MidA family methyltransferase